MVDGRVYQWNVHTDQSQRQSGDEDEDDEEEEEDEDFDEIGGKRSRFPAGFLPMRMCR